MATTGRNRNPVDVRYNNPARRDHAAAGSCGGSWGPAGASGRGCRRPEQRSSREATSSATCTSRAGSSVLLMAMKPGTSQSVTKLATIKKSLSVA